MASDKNKPTNENSPKGKEQSKELPKHKGTIFAA